MSAGKHTPGPWSVENLGRDGDHEVVAPDPVFLGRARIVADRLLLADARLVAAAPDLLDAGVAALRSMFEMHSSVLAGKPVVLDRGAYDALVAAIAKARGE